jgi:hypothetical protein
LSKKRFVIQTVFSTTTYTSRNVFLKSGINSKAEHNVALLWNFYRSYLKKVFWPPALGGIGRSVPRIAG